MTPTMTLERAMQARAREDWPGVFTLVTQAYQSLVTNSRLFGFPFGLERADLLLAEMGQAMVANHTRENHQKPRACQGDLFLATTLYVDGGHTPVIGDIAQGVEGPPMGLWVTQCPPLYHTSKIPDQAFQHTRLAHLVRVFNTHEDPWQHCLSMIEALWAAPPKRMFLFHHPEDCSAVVLAAVVQALGGEVYLFHHSDTSLSAGLYLPGIKIIEFTPNSQWISRFLLGLPSTLIPLSCPDPGEYPQMVDSAGALITCLSGSFPKLAAMHSPTYGELLVHLLKTTGGRHVHIGHIPSVEQKDLEARLIEAGLSPTQVTWIDHAETLVAALRDQRVDLMINTFPQGGARTAVEAMAAGMPMIWHSPSPELDFLRAQMRYPEAPIWRSLSDLTVLIRNCDRTWLASQRRAARAHYLARHHPRHLADHLKRLPQGFDHPLPTEVNGDLVLWNAVSQAVQSSKELNRPKAASETIGSLRKDLDRIRFRYDQLLETQRQSEAMRDREYAQFIAQSKLLEQERQKSWLLWQRVQELEASTSWRLTKPVRAISISLQTTLFKIMGSPQRLRRNLFQGRQIIRANGLRHFIERVQNKLWRQYQGLTFQSRYRPVVVESEWRPLWFEAHDSPLVSIIIPVHNHHPYTYTCLKSLAQEKPGPEAPPFEIVVVDDHSEDETPLMLAAMEGLRVVQNPEQLGFVAACNLGAEHARGAILIFLNNDTVVPAGTLRCVAETLRERPEVGLLGAKLLYPDGRLQEAGGIVWRDGSAWNHGRGDDPDQPQYNYVREVDYCSGAFLAIPRDLFEEVGGFSNRYAPAYYEDTDLAFKVRDAGRKVIYQPLVQIIHFEGVSNGADLFSGLKRYQQVNQLKFSRKWNARLATHQPNGVLAEIVRDRGVKGRILVVDIYMPTPDRDSGSFRMVRLLELLRLLQMKVTFVADNLELRPPYGTRLQQMGVEVLHAPHVQSIRQYLKHHGRYFDHILLSRADVADAYSTAVRQFAPEAKLIFDTVDLRYLRESRLAALEKDPHLLKSAEKQKQLELDLIRAADVTLVVSSVEKEILSADVPRARIEILSNIHDLTESVQPFGARAGILFVGSFEHPPNADAVRYLVRQVLPLVEATLGGVTFYIIGDAAPAKIRDLASDTIRFEGYVEDISEYFQTCRLSVAPLRYGAGVKGKINQSMAHGLPVVSTSIGVEGMHLSHGHDVLIGDDAQTFAQQIAAVYRDESLWQRLSQNGRRNVATHFSPEAAQATLSKLLDLT